jgi:hypothetical protein
MKKAILSAMIAAGCATHDTVPTLEPLPKEIPIVVYSSCPDTIVVLGDVEPWTDYDQSMVKLMNDGCRRRYSPLHCAVKITKTSVQEYAIICGFRERSHDDKALDRSVHP